MAESSQHKTQCDQGCKNPWHNSGGPLGCPACTPMPEDKTEFLEALVGIAVFGWLASPTETEDVE